MTRLDPAELVKPVSADAPCGPDLELAGDPDYVQAVGRIEGTLPTSFFTRDDEGKLQPFDRSKIEIAPALKEIGTLLDTTRDLRLLTLAGRLCALNRDLDSVANVFGGIGALLQERWTDVHPAGEDGDFGLRMAVLQTLDDMPTMVLPLQHMTLAEHRRFGVLNFRTVMVAAGEVAPPGGENPPDRAAIDRILAEADLDALRASLDRVVRLGQAVDTIRAITIEQVGFEASVSLDKVAGLTGRMRELLDGVVAGRDPTAALPAAEAAPRVAEAGEAPAQGGAAPVRPAGAIADAKQAGRMLVAAGRYLQTCEPSSPAELLVRQAQGLVGRSFLEVMRILVPNHAEEAKIAIGADRAFELTFGQLASVSETSPAAETASDGWSDWSDGSSSGGEETGSGEGETAPEIPPVTSRREAVGILRQVSGFYRVAEPASPIPLLLDRACAMAESDFLTILKDVLPGLRKVEGGEAGGGNGGGGGSW